jgi:hypothetical protein
MGSNPAKTKEKREAGASGLCGPRPALKELVRESTRALAHLEAERLEELASSCIALSSGLASNETMDRVALAAQAWEAANDMAVFARVLQATRANLNVMRQLRKLNGERLEYGEGEVRGWVEAEAGHGDH